MLQLTLCRGRWASGFDFSPLDLHVEKQIGHDGQSCDHLVQFSSASGVENKRVSTLCSPSGEAL